MVNKEHNIFGLFYSLMDAKTRKDLKIIFIGDMNTGKTFLISSFIFGHSIVPKKPILFGSYYKEMEYKGEIYRLRICDTSGSREFIRLQEMSYLDADLLVLCVDGSQATSLKSAECYAMQSKKARLPVMLCITKVDLGMNLSRPSINEFISKHGINNEVQCSASDKRSIMVAFEKIMEACLEGVFIEPRMCGGEGMFWCF